MDFKGGCIRLVRHHERDAALNQAGNEMHLARKAVERRNQKHRPRALAMLKGGFELRPVLMALAAFDVGVFGKEFSGVTQRGSALSVQTEAADSLAGRADAKVGHKGGH